MSLPSPQHRHSFLIRIWRQPTPFDVTAMGGWRAYIQHIQSGEGRYIDDIPSLIAFFEQWTGTLREDDAHSQPST